MTLRPKRARQQSEEERAAPGMPEKVEPLSPELALIDPESARVQLALLETSAALASPASAPSALLRPPAPAPEAGAERSRRHRRRWTAALACVAAASLGLNGFLAALVLTRDRTDAAPHPAPAVPAPPAAAVGVTAPAGPGAIEARILSLVLQSGRGRLPSTLMDPATGLPKANLQAVCHDGPAGSKLCIVRPARHRPGEGLAVRYTPTSDGRGTFTWSRYRTARP